MNKKQQNLSHLSVDLNLMVENVYQSNNGRSASELGTNLFFKNGTVFRISITV